MGKPVQRAPGVWGVQFKIGEQRFSGTFSTRREAETWQERRKAELRARGYRILDAAFAPDGYVLPDGMAEDKPKRRRRTAVDDAAAGEDHDADR